MGMPAARITDPHICPMVNPGPAAIPHVGMPIVGPGAPTVLIESLPAAVQGDTCPCAGPPDVIAGGSGGVFFEGKAAARMGDLTAHGGSILAGCGTVLVGESGGGGGGGSGEGSEAESLEREPLVIELLDEEGIPVANQLYQIELPDGSIKKGLLDSEGKATILGIEPGDCKVTFPDVNETDVE